MRHPWGSLAVFGALVLLVPLLAGCLGDHPDAEGPSEEQVGLAGIEEISARLSKPLADEVGILHEALDFDTRHGIVHVDVWRPDVEREGGFPVIVVASPYNSGAKDNDENWVSEPAWEWVREHLVPRGYAFAQLDALGTRNSGGCMGVNNVEERQSTADAIDALAEEEWASGDTGMIGRSYRAKLQLGAAIEHPDSLRTIVPVSGVSHQYGYHYYNAVPYLGNQATNAAYMGTSSAPPPDGDPVEYAPRYVERFPCMPEHLVAGVDPRGDYTERWQERDYRPHVADIDPEVSLFFIHGLQDWNVKPDHIPVQFEDHPGPKTAWLGQWAHVHPDATGNENTLREDWYFMLHRWFDHFLMGIDTGLIEEIEACPVQVQATDAKWRCMDAYPPRPAGDGRDPWPAGNGSGSADTAQSSRFVQASGGVQSLEATDGSVDSNATRLRGEPFPPLAPTRFSVLHPHADGTLQQEAGSGTLEYHDFPRDTVSLLDAGPAPQELRFAVPVDAPMRIVGEPQVSLRLETTSPFNTFASVALGVERDGQLHQFTWGFHSLRHHDGKEQGDAIVPGTAYDLQFALYPVDQVLEPGDELVLLVRGDSQGARVSVIPNPTPGVQTVHLGDTSLEIPWAGHGESFLPAGYAHMASEHQPAP